MKKVTPSTYRDNYLMVIVFHHHIESHEQKSNFFCMFQSLTFLGCKLWFQGSQIASCDACQKPVLKDKIIHYFPIIPRLTMVFFVQSYFTLGCFTLSFFSSISYCSYFKLNVLPKLFGILGRRNLKVSMIFGVVQSSTSCSKMKQFLLFNFIFTKQRCIQSIGYFFFKNDLKKIQILFFCI